MTILLLSVGFALGQLDPTKDDLQAELDRADYVVRRMTISTEINRVQINDVQQALRVQQFVFQRDRAKFDEKRITKITKTIQGIEDNLRCAMEKQKALQKLKTETESCLAEAEKLKA